MHDAAGCCGSISVERESQINLVTIVKTFEVCSQCVLRTVVAASIAIVTNAFGKKMPSRKIISQHRPCPDSVVAEPITCEHGLRRARAARVPDDERRFTRYSILENSVKLARRLVLDKNGLSETRTSVFLRAHIAGKHVATPDIGTACSSFLSLSTCRHDRPERAFYPRLYCVRIGRGSNAGRR